MGEIFIPETTNNPEELVNYLKKVINEYDDNKIENERFKATGDSKYEWDDEKYWQSIEWARIIHPKIPDTLKKIIEEEYNGYHLKGRYGDYKNWTDIPYVTIYDKPNIDIRLDFYPVFLFKPVKGSGVYLSLGLGTGNFTNPPKKTPLSKKDISTLNRLKEVFKSIFLFYYNSNNNLGFNLNNFCDQIDLHGGDDFEGDHNHSEDYEAGTIFAKEYSLEKLSTPGVEEELKNDIFEMLEIFNFAKKYEIFEKVKEISKFNPLDWAERENIGENILLYGVPGSGKSYTIENEYCDDETITERILFHPDYTYSDFVGQILPNVSEEDQIEYKFTPGPFTSILEKAYKNPEQKYILIIEEINRGNAPAIFGDIFQLLDRKTEFKEQGKDDGYRLGTSEYEITNSNIAGFVYDDEEHPVKIPANLSILATMNTSDQNVFTLDTAFKRRWTMRMIENSFEDTDFDDLTILNTGLLWKDFCDVINKSIVENNISNLSSEDKRIGAYFVDKKDLEFNENVKSSSSKEEKIKAKLHNDKFAEKVLMYLWDDALKLSREEVFDEENLDQFTLEFIVNKFNNAENEEERFTIFTSDIQTEFKSKMGEYKRKKEEPVPVETQEETDSSNAEEVENEIESENVGSNDE